VARESEQRLLSRARRGARKLLAQSLYQLQLSGAPWQDLYHQYLEDPDAVAADTEFFRELLMNIAADCSGWFWATRHLNELADNDDLLTITKRINGGTNGLDDRARRLKLAKCLLIR